MSDIKPPDMAGVPERIWLVMGDPPPEPGTNFRELVEVHWCEDQMFGSDIEYTRVNRNQNAVDVDDLLRAMRRAVCALAAASNMNPAFNNSYRELNRAIDRATAAQENNHGDTP